MKTVNNQQFLSYSEVAQMAHLSVSSVPTLVCRGTFTPVKFDRDARKYVAIDEVNQYLSSKHTGDNNSNVLYNKDTQNQHHDDDISSVSQRLAVKMSILKTIGDVFTKIVDTAVKSGITTGTNQFAIMVTPLLSGVLTEEKPTLNNPLLEQSLSSAIPLLDDMTRDILKNGYDVERIDAIVDNNASIPDDYKQTMKQSLNDIAKQLNMVTIGDSNVS